MKKIICICLALLMSFGLIACQDEKVKEVDDNTTQATDAVDVEHTTIAEAESEEAESQTVEQEKEAYGSRIDDPELSLTEAERKQGTSIYFPAGAKFALPQVFNDHHEQIRRVNRQFDVGPDLFIDASREYYFKPSDNPEKYMDYPIFGVIAVDESRRPEDEEQFNEKMLYPELEQTREDAKRSQYFGLGSLDTEAVQELGEEDRAIYEQLLEAAKQVRKSIYLFPPTLPEESIGASKNWRFKTVNLEDEAVDQEILKDHEVTLISFMTTWCPHCIDELEDFVNAKKEFLDEKNANIIGIFADIVPEQAGSESYEKAMKAAKELSSKYGINFPVLQNSYDMQNSLTKYAMNYPTNFFVDSNGDVLSVHIGKYQDLEAAFAEAIALSRGEEVSEDKKDTEDKEDTDASSEELSDADIAEILADPELNLSREDQEAGYQVLLPLGAKFKAPAKYLEDFSPWQRLDIDNADQADKALRYGREFYYYPSVNAEGRFKKFPLFGFYVFNKDKAPEDLEKLVEDLNIKDLTKIFEDDHVVQYFAKGKADPKGLKSKEKQEFKELFDGVEDIEDSLYAFRALGIDEVIGRKKNWQFKTKNLLGEEVDEKIFEQEALTIVSYMTTWCPYCIEELPRLEAVNADTDNSVQVLYLIGNYDLQFLSKEEQAQTLTDLEEIFEEGIRGRVLEQTIVINNSLTRIVPGFPCNIVFDSAGNVLAYQLGGLDEVALDKLIQEASKLVNQQK
ncbi:MAG: redoxin domain-containing protein [Eubacteriales bacterium]|nr:redoxin domain-containing protein [Eubacteriales bacterium]